MKKVLFLVFLVIQTSFLMARRLSKIERVPSKSTEIVSVSSIPTLSVVEYPVPFVAKPVYYDDAFFGFTDTMQFSRLDKKGHVRWHIAKAVTDISDVQIQFNTLFLLQKSGTLEAYDCRMGFRQWKRTGIPIQAVKIRYPIVYFIDMESRVGNLDFLTGQLISQGQSIWMGPQSEGDSASYELKRLLGKNSVYKQKASLLSVIQVDQDIFLFTQK